MLSTPAFQMETGMLICAMITSTALRWPSDVPISNLSSAGLKTPCQIRMKLFTLPQDLVLSVKGRLTAADQAKLIKQLQHICHLKECP